MTCEEIQQTLSEYLDHALDDAECTEVESHLASCLRCRGELAALNQTVRAVGGLKEMKPPRDFSRTVMDRIRGEQQKPSLWQRLFSPWELKIPVQALAVLLVSSVAVYLYLNTERSQVDILQEIDSSPPVPTDGQPLGAAANRDDEKGLTAAPKQQPESTDGPDFAPSPPSLPAGRKPAAPVKKPAPSRETEGSRQPSLKNSRAIERAPLPEASLPARKAMEPAEQQMRQEKILQLPPPPTGRETSDATSALQRSPLADRAAGDAMEEETGLLQRTVEPPLRAQFHLSLTPFNSNTGAGVIEKKIRSIVQRLGGQVYPEAPQATTYSAEEGLASNTLRISLPGNRYGRFRESLGSLGEFGDQVQGDSATSQEASGKMDPAALDWIEIRLTVR